MNNISDKSCRENQNTFYGQYIFFENRAVCKIMWKNIVEPARPQMTIWHMRITCWTPKATNTQSEYVIFIALPLQQWLHKRSSMLHYMYIACLVNLCQSVVPCECVVSVCVEIYASAVQNK